jgi:hypothetical protein
MRLSGATLSDILRRRLPRYAGAGLERYKRKPSGFSSQYLSHDLSIAHDFRADNGRALRSDEFRPPRRFRRERTGTEKQGC